MDHDRAERVQTPLRADNRAGVMEETSMSVHVHPPLGLAKVEGWTLSGGSRWLRNLAGVDSTQPMEATMARRPCALRLAGFSMLVLLLALPAAAEAGSRRA